MIPPISHCRNHAFQEKPWLLQKVTKTDVWDAEEVDENEKKEFKHVRLFLKQI